MVERETVTIKKACETLGVSRRTIYNWINAGKVEHLRTAGGSIRIFEDTLWRTPSKQRLKPGSTTIDPFRDRGVA